MTSDESFRSTADSGRCELTRIGESVALSLDGEVRVSALTQTKLAQNVGTAERLQERIDLATGPETDSSKPVWLCDLTDVKYIELPALLLLNGLANARSQTHRLALALPANEDVLAFLVKWNYVKSFMDAGLIRSERDTLGDQHRRYESATGRTAALAERLTTPEGEMTTLLPRNYYEIKSFPHAQRLDRTFAEDIARAWNRPHVVDVLKRVMGPEQGKWVAQTVFRQMLENALMHPQATIIQHGAQHEKRGGDYPPLRVALWDNGDSIVDTLKVAMKAGAVAIPSPVADDISIDLQVVPFGARDSSPRIECRLTGKELVPRAEDPDWRILLAALMPGVTRRATSAAMLPASIGLGLHQIASEATNRYNGTFSIWTRDIYLLVRPGVEQNNYGVDIWASDDGSFVPRAFSGNLLAVSLPGRARRHVA